MGHAMGRKTKNLVGLSTYEVFLPSLAETKSAVSESNDFQWDINTIHKFNGLHAIPVQSKLLPSDLIRHLLMGQMMG